MNIHQFLPEGFSPLLAATTNDAKLKKHFAAGGRGYGSYKFDGIRAVGAGKAAFSRSGILIPNLFVQSEFASGLYDNLDGELIVGTANDYDICRTTNSAVMSIKGEPDFKYYVFDDVSAPNQGYGKRLLQLEKRAKGRVVIVEQRPINTYDELAELESEALELGYEGGMYRKEDGLYIYGRSTATDMHLMKLKRMSDMELEVFGFEEAMHNGNPAEKDAFGRTKRSSRQENLSPLGRVGKFLTRYNGRVLKVAPGRFKHPDLVHIWNNQEKFIGKLLKFEYFGHGMKDLPRHPIAIGWREKIDT